MNRYLRLLLALLIIFSLFYLVVGCASDSGVLPKSGSVLTSKSPHGTYTATMLGIKATLTFSGDTITTYDDYDGKTISKYYLTNQPIVRDNGGWGTPIPQPRPTTNVPANEAVTICLQDVTKNVSYLKSFKYVPEQDIVVLNDVPYYK